MSDWQPIDSAPKDGTTILLFGPYAEYPSPAKWDRSRWLAVWDGYMVISAEGDWGTDYREFEVPTHWAPLPEPPKP